MPVEYICDGCGTRQPAVYYPATGHVGKPAHWYERSDDDGLQVACSRACIDRIAAQSGKIRVILPL